MTFFEPTILRLSVESFRGFRDLQEFDLAASAVILTGPNGTGKTSFFDALQWCMVGSIGRLESLRARRNVEHIVNQYRIGRKATVEVELQTGAGRIIARRTGDYSGSSLELRREGSTSVFGADADEALRRHLLPGTELTLEAALTTSGLMQQDVMRGVLEAKPADRYRHISTVLGLSRLEDFEEATRSLARDAGERLKRTQGERGRIAGLLDRGKEKLAESRTRLESAPQLEAIRSDLQALLAATPPHIAGPPASTELDGDKARELWTQLGAAVEAVDRLASLVRRCSELRPASSEAPPTSDDLADLHAELDRASTHLASAESEHAAVQRELQTARDAAQEVAQLAALAIPLLGDRCPVCTQPIDPDQVAAELRERAGGTTTITSLMRVQSEREAARRAAVERADVAQAELQAALRQAAQWNEYRAAEADVEAALDHLRGGDFVVRTTAKTVEEWSLAARRSSEYLESVRRRVLEFLDALERQTERGAVERAMAEVARLESALLDGERAVAEESRRATRLQALAEQSTAARIDVTEHRVKAMQPLVSNIYQRLDPHPAFKAVEFELDTYYRRGTTSALVRDSVEGISADPLMIFSTSQANIVALSYFIAMSLSSGNRGLPFLLLDDPIQSMDDVNVLGFADLCRHLRMRRQMIVSTHERRFAGLLERKLAPRTSEYETKVIRFTGWDRSGPTVDQSVVSPQLTDKPIRIINLAS